MKILYAYFAFSRRFRYANLQVKVETWPYKMNSGTKITETKLTEKVSNG